MKSTYGKMIILALMCSLFLAVSPVTAGQHDKVTNPNESLFVNLTSDDVNRAAMAIMFATMTKKQSGINVTIFLNVEGVRLADNERPSAIWVGGMEGPKTIHQILSAFMAAGGTIIACPMCMKNVGGMDPNGENLFDQRIVLGDHMTVSQAMFGPRVTVLSY